MVNKPLKTRALSLLMAVCVILSPAIQLSPSASAANTISGLSAEIRSRYGFDASSNEDFALRNMLSNLAFFPDGMIKEMTDAFRRRGITPAIRHTVTGSDDIADAAFGEVTGSASLFGNSLTLTLHYSFALPHEVGHAIDWHLESIIGGCPSDGLHRFNNGLQYGSWVTGFDHSDVFITAYAATSASEDFAELIDAMISNPWELYTFMDENPNASITRKVHYIADILIQHFSSLRGRENFPILFPESVIKVFVNGAAVVFDYPPITENGRTLVPLRPVFEALGAGVDWNMSTQTITARRYDVTIILRVGSNVLLRNNAGIQLEVPAMVVNGRTLVPLRAIAESFDTEVGWDSNTRTVSINQRGLR